MNQPLTKSEIIKTYDHPMDAILSGKGRYMDSQQITNRHSEIEQERDIESMKRHKRIGLYLTFFFGLPALVVFLSFALGGNR